MTKKISNLHIREIMEIVTTDDDFNGKKKQAKVYGDWLVGGTGRCALALHKDGFNYEPAQFEKGDNELSCLMPGEWVGRVNMDTFRAEYFPLVDKIIDRRLVGHAYYRYLADDMYKLVKFAGSYFTLSVLDQAWRMTMLCGMEWTEVYRLESGMVQLEAHVGDDIGVVIVMMPCNYTEDCHNHKIIGQLACFPNKEIVRAQADAELALQNLDIMRKSLKQAEADALDSRKVYAVTLTMTHTTYVLANSAKEAEKIAEQWVDSDDFDDGIEAESAEESSIEEAEDADELYDKDGEVDIDEYRESLEDDDDEEE